MVSPTQTEETKSVERLSNHQEQFDEYENIVRNTGCYQENQELQLCFTDKHDWRLCKVELEKFKECWKNNKKKHSDEFDSRQ
ncbi:41139_t:CDS:1, partial [Gigaspora margarita]|uniref:Mitochondrial respiratory chain complex assembly protein n=2 Tax=Gigaspora margarita TaxID=4874 RepID=A0A8H3WVV7_GIGMA